MQTSAPSQLNSHQRETLAILLAGDDGHPIFPTEAAKSAPVRPGNSPPAMTSATPQPDPFKAWPVWRLVASFSLAFFGPMVVLETVEGSDLQRLLLALAATSAWAVPTLYFRTLAAVVRRGHATNSSLQAEIHKLEGELELAKGRVRLLTYHEGLRERTIEELRIEFNASTQANGRLRDEVVSNAKKHDEELKLNAASLKERLAEVWARLKQAELALDASLEELQQKTNALDAATTTVNLLAPRIEALEFENVDLQQQADLAMATVKQREHWTPVAISDEDFARALAETLK